MAKQARGFKSSLLMAVESSYKTLPVTPTVYKIPINSNTIGGTQGLIDPNTITGRRDPIEPGRGTVDVGGQMQVPLCANNIGLICLLMMGEPTTTGANVAGYLLGGSGVTDTIATWTAVTAGKFKVAINGSAATEIGPIDFSSGVTTMANVASKIQTAVRAIATGGFSLATVTWDATNKRFIITSGTTGAASTVSALTAPAAGTDISGSGFMKGTTGTSVSGETLYQHVFKLSDDMPSATLQKTFPDVNSYGLIPGVKIAKFSMEAAMGNNDISATIEAIGANETYSSSVLSSSPTVLDIERLNPFQGAIYENDVEMSGCRKFGLDVEFGLDGDTFCFNSSGNPERDDIVEGGIKITGKIETLFRDMTLLNKAISGAKTALKFKFVSGNKSLEIKLPEIQLERKSPETPGPKGIIFDPSFTAFYKNNADNSALVITLINGVAAYEAP